MNLGNPSKLLLNANLQRGKLKEPSDDDSRLVWITLDSEHEAELATDPKQRENWIKLAKLATLWREEEEAATTRTAQERRG